MRFGCCGSMIAPARDSIGVEIVETAAEIGFDYIELSLRDVTELSAPAYARLRARMARAGIPCEACNNFFPARLRLTGAEADPAAAVDYAEKALERASGLGARIVVFGSSGARNVPDGFAPDRAWRQIVELLDRLAPAAARYGITIAIEPLARLESNIITTTAEGLRMAREVNRGSIGLLVDFFHFTAEGDDPAVLLEAGSAIRHVHFAAGEGRRFPRERETGSPSFFAGLKRIKYGERCSLEAFTDDFEPDARRALRLLKELAGP